MNFAGNIGHVLETTLDFRCVAVIDRNPWEQCATFRCTDTLQGAFRIWAFALCDTFLGKITSMTHIFPFRGDWCSVSEVVEVNTGNATNTAHHHAQTNIRGYLDVESNN